MENQESKNKNQNNNPNNNPNNKNEKQLFSMRKKSFYWFQSF